MRTYTNADRSPRSPRSPRGPRCRPGRSESALESWNKHIRNFRSGAGCRSRQTPVSANIHDIFVRMLITSAPAIAHARRNVLKRQVQACEIVNVPNQEEAIIRDIYN